MNHFSKINIVLLKIIISNVITVYTIDEPSQNNENQTTITIGHMHKLIREYPGFIKLTLQKNDYYTGKDVSRCPMPYNENTILDDPDVGEFEFFDPRECDEPWTWTQKNEIDVPVPVNGTIGKKLGNIIQPCLKDNSNIIQCYTHYLNVMESVGLTIVDRFCLFLLEVIERLDDLDDIVDYTESLSLFEIVINFPALNLIIEKFEEMLDHISDAFKKYYISTLPLDYVENILESISINIETYEEPFDKNDKDMYDKILECRKLTQLKKSYVVLDIDPYWTWDVTSEIKPDDNLIILTQYENINIGMNLFSFKK